jgi:hypothetical protein
LPSWPQSFVHESRLAHARHHDLALATKQQIDGFVELIVQSLDEGLHGARFDPQDATAFTETPAVRLVGRC